MILSDRTIRAAIAAGRIGIDPLDPTDIQPSSVDLHLDRFFRVFRNHTMRVIDVRKDQEELTELVEIAGEEVFVLHPGEFVLGSTLERVSLPDDMVGRLEGKSSLGRLGLLIHSTAGFVDAGWDGYLTLELSNVANLPIILYPAMKIGQISFLQMTTPADHPYGSGAVGSKYQGQRGPPRAATSRTSGPGKSQLLVDRADCHLPIGGHRPARVGRQLPEETERISEVAVEPAEGGPLGRFQDGGARRLRPVQAGNHVVLGGHHLRQRHRRRTARCSAACRPDVGLQVRGGEQAEKQAMTDLDEGDLPGHIQSRFPAQPVHEEATGGVDIGDTQGDEVHSRLHAPRLAPAAAWVLNGTAMPSSYREWADPTADPAVQCRWQQQVGATEGSRVKRVLPDACADLIVTADGSAVVVGPATRVHLPRLTAPTTIRGIRFRTEAIRAAFATPASELQDQQVPLADIVDTRVAAWLSEAVWTGAALPAWSSLTVDGRVQAATRRLWSEPTVEVTRVAAAVNLSGRQLRRLLLVETGLGPKMLQRVGRLQRFLALAERPPTFRDDPRPGLAVLAALAGYADQAHLTRDARELSGATPARLLAERAEETNTVLR